MDDQRIKEILIQQNESFKNLDIRHRQCEQQLKELTSQSFKTDREFLEERNLKKQKLKIKDSMQRYIFEYRKGRS
jgi:uncharacterized protein YdcH (DUF465 family)